jgi:WD40 repeat protein
VSAPAVIDAHGRHAQAVRFTRDGKLLVSAGQDACVRLWSVPGFKTIRAFEGHQNSVNSLSFSPDEKMLATGSSDRTVRLWSFPDGRCLHTFEKQLVAVFSPEGDRVATVSGKGQVTLWDPKSAKQVWVIPALEKRVVALAFSPGGSSLLAGGLGVIHQLAVADGRKLSQWNAHKSMVCCLRMNPDGKQMASTGADGYLRLWSTKNWEESHSAKLQGPGVFQIAFSPSGDSVTVAADHVIQSFSTKDASPTTRIQLPLKGLYGIAISPDGKYLANAAADGRIRIWNQC